MNDQIKTQHGTIGLLMAECEQLRRDLEQAKADNLELYKKWVGLRQSLTEAKAELGAWQSAFGTTQLSHALEAYEKAKAENARLAAALGSIRCSNTYCNGRTYLAFGHDDKTWAITTERVECPTCKTKQAGVEHLRDLLAPTIELLHGLHGYLSEDDRAIHNELSRLRSILHSNDNSEKVKS